jgi:predicted secreted protein
MHPHQFPLIQEGSQKSRTITRSLLALSAIAFLFLDSQVLATVFKASRRLSGFSTDSSHYIYLESSRNIVTEVPLAQIQILNVKTNSCEPNGCLKTDYDNSSSNLSNHAAEDDLLKKTFSLRQNFGLNRLKVGTSLPIISHASKADRSQTIQVRLPSQKEPLQIRLEQKYIPSILSPRGSSDIERASMRLVISNKNHQLTIGNLNNYREAVKNYSIREVRLSPNGRNVVVLIDMTQPSYEGVLQSTFVQGFPL